MYLLMIGMVSISLLWRNAVSLSVRNIFFLIPPTYEGGVKAGKEITLSRKTGQKASFLPLLRRKSRSG